MEPWVQPAYDALEQLLAKPRKPEQFEKKKQSGRKSQAAPPPSVAGAAPGKTARPYDPLIQAGRLEIEAITLGRVTCQAPDLLAPHVAHFCVPWCQVRARRGVRGCLCVGWCVRDEAVGGR